MGLAVMAKQPVKPKPTATTWVMRDQFGEMVPIKVADMSDAHLFRWIGYFRKKLRDSGFDGSDALLDATLRVSMVTAPAIFAEARKRGVYKDPPLTTLAMQVATKAKATTAAPFTTPTGPAPAANPPMPGTRRIDLEDD